jgi:hypothetical protein
MKQTVFFTFERNRLIDFHSICLKKHSDVLKIEANRPERFVSIFTETGISVSSQSNRNSQKLKQTD